MKSYFEIICTVLSLFFFLFTGIVFPAGEPDYIYREHRKYEIEEEDTHYELTSEVEISNKYLTKRSLDKKIYYIPEVYFEKFKKFRALQNITWLNEDHVGVKSDWSKDVFISDTKIHYIHLDNIKIGDMIKYNYESRIKDLVFTPIIAIPNVNLVEEFKIEIEHPEELYIDFEFFFPQRKLNYRIEREDDLTTITFDSLYKNPEISYSPFNDVQAYILPVIKKNGIPVNGINPQEFIRWYINLSKFNPQISTQNRNLFDSLLAGTNKPVDKLNIIYDYVKSNVRYIADERDLNAIIPRSPDVVLEKRYGDCKDKAFLISAIAALYGIKVSPVLVNADDELEFPFVHPSLYNHVICCYENQGRELFFDPTAKYNSLRTIPLRLISKHAFVLDSLNPHISIIGNEYSEPEIEVNISAGIDSLSEATALITLNKEYSAYAKYAINERNKSDLENYFSFLIAKKLSSIGLEHFKIKDTLDYETVTIEAKANLSSFIVSSTSKKYVTRTPFILFDNNIFEREKDSLQLWLDPMAGIKLNIDIKGSGFDIQPDSLLLSDEETGISFFSKCLSKSGSISLFSYGFNPPVPGSLSNDKKKSLLAFCKDYYKTKKQMFLLKGKEL